jgi:hypothetical protein
VSVTRLRPHVGSHTVAAVAVRFPTILEAMLDTRAVVDHHFEAVRAAAMSVTMADYAEDGVIISTGRTSREAAAISAATQGAFEGGFRLAPAS